MRQGKPAERSLMARKSRSSVDRHYLPRANHDKLAPDGEVIASGGRIKRE
jgi:hypothetical protein